ncbi:MAG: hydrogenase (NiFe) small subunit HydA [Candidatus Aramenus sulfurataquae]|jgi:Ni,Fe-hydrogenase I small subunit|uniref:Hydrogenase (NiFe) small subunit HydA n=3 Tax=Candidatus Aramenus sulfurataquae TaxID=1326980 RepID=W7KT26_9CREN|nr:MAG: hydrogenase (NiFe) small subunit HydA [Candidatus Aramenus sulfurataquae]
MDYCQALKEVLTHNIVWLEAQSCSGETVMMLKEGCEGLDDLFFHSSPVKLISIVSEDKSGPDMLKDILDLDNYLLVVEGAIPKDDKLCNFGGMTCSEILKKLSEKAIGIVAVGSCAVNGGIIREVGGLGVGEVLKRKVYEVPGCPASDKTMVAMLYYVLKGGK